LSELVIDRVVAGLEIITPKLVAETVALDQIESAAGGDINLNLADDGGLKINDSQGETGISFDANGNATFQGTVTAEAIVAKKILGLEIFTNQISGIDESVSVLAEKLDGLETDSEETLDLSILGILEKKGSLVLAKETQFQEATIFEKLSTFAGNVLFRGEISFEKVPTFNKDTAGYALIKEGADSVEVVFEKKYANLPVVNASLALQKIEDEKVRQATEELLLMSDVKFIITDVTTKGFKIKVGQTALSDIPFSWQALAVNEMKTFESEKATSPNSIESVFLNPIPVYNNAEAEASVEKTIPAGPAIPSENPLTTSSFRVSEEPAI